MDDNQLYNTVANHWIVRNQMIRIPLETYFKDQLSRKLAESYPNKIPIFNAIIGDNPDERVRMNAVEAMWAKFMFAIANTYCTMTSIETLKANADDFIDDVIEYEKFRDHKMADDNTRNRMMADIEEAKKDAIFCLSAHYFVFLCVAIIGIFIPARFQLSMYIGCILVSLYRFFNEDLLELKENLFKLIEKIKNIKEK